MVSQRQNEGSFVAWPDLNEDDEKDEADEEMHPPRQPRSCLNPPRRALGLLLLLPGSKSRVSCASSLVKSRQVKHGTSKSSDRIQHV